jgi:hypothetical protein
VDLVDLEALLDKSVTSVVDLVSLSFDKLYATACCPPTLAETQATLPEHATEVVSEVVSVEDHEVEWLSDE